MAATISIPVEEYMSLCAAAAELEFLRSGEQKVEQGSLSDEAMLPASLVRQLTTGRNTGKSWRVVMEDGAIISIVEIGPDTSLN